MPTLADLDRAFNDVWLHTDQLPVLLEEWQKLVTEVLQAQEADARFVKEFKQYMDRWEVVLSENRDLLQQHQETLKQQIKQGEPKVSSQDISKTFSSDQK